MSSQANSPARNCINILCSPEAGAWRVYLRPTRLPRYLSKWFDEHGEVFPVLLDFVDLDRFMQQRGFAYDKHISRRDDVELTAHGEAANALALWLANTFASTERSSNDDSPARDGTA